ncbi:MAG TPA: response regulator [Bryobacteraceae bacterium]|nr:response regulator [Bryobacteraceae bacterium]
MPKRRTALLIEDSPTQAERLRRQLALADLDVTHVLSAEAGLDLLATMQPDLIVVDHHLPGKNGNDFCREIKANVNTRAIPVLMLTVDQSDAGQMRGLESGADDYVAKSADPDILCARIRALLRDASESPSIVGGDNSFRPARVLAIDDSPAYLYFIERELRRENYVVETALGAEEGMKKLSAAPFDCVLVDFEMPGSNGTEVCRHIRGMGDESNPQVVLIMLSSHEDKEHMQAGFDAGADDYISKSADSAVIRARIGALLRRKSLVEQNRRILDELREGELKTVRAQAAREAAEIRAQMADRLAAANAKLEEANRGLEEFAYSMAHDLQEPLRMIGISSQLLQRGYGGEVSPKGQEFLTMMVKGVARMDTFIRDLLSYVRAVSSEEEVPRAAADLNAIAARVLENLDAARLESGSEIVLRHLPTLVVEQTRIQQLLQNLIGNAIRYRREDVPCRIEVSAERREGEWLFSVADNGIGIDPKDAERIFQPFKRLERGKSPGTGLGLAICRRIVEQHGGRIWVESVRGEGSTFRFTLTEPVSNADT